MSWILDHLDDIWSLTVSHTWLAGVPLLLGLLISLPLGWLANRHRRIRGAVVVSAGLLYTVPNFFGEAPAVQVSSGKSTLKLTDAPLPSVPPVFRPRLLARGSTAAARQ